MNERHHQSSHSGIRDEEDWSEKLGLCCLLMPTVNIIWQGFFHCIGYCLPLCFVNSITSLLLIGLRGSLHCFNGVVKCFVMVKFPLSLFLSLVIYWDMCLKSDFRGMCLKQKPISQKWRS